MGSMISSVKPPAVYKLSLILIVAGKKWLWPTHTLFDSWVPGVCLGVPIFVAGVYVAIDSKKTFKKTGTPMMGRATSTSPLHTSGYFSYTRNPMYLGISVALLGAALVSNCSYNLAFPIVNAVIMNECYIPVEERQLEEAFGSKYLMYKKSVPRWL
jgi:protein-S-isoprenylcysteine O-methyltransferase Ste14